MSLFIDGRVGALLIVCKLIIAKPKMWLWYIINREESLACLQVLVNKSLTQLRSRVTAEVTA